MIDYVSELFNKSSKLLIVVDLGCGWGSLISELAKNFPKHTFVGIEWGAFTSKSQNSEQENLKIYKL